MRQELLLPSLRHRVTHRSNLLMVLLVGVLLAGFRVFANPSHIRIGELLAPFLFLFLQVALAPIPWLWNSPAGLRGHFMPRFLRALVFNAVWVTIALSVMHLFTPLSSPVNQVPQKAQTPPQGPPPLPMDMGFGSPLIGRRPDQGPRPPKQDEGPRRRPFPLLPVLGIGLLNVAFALIFGWEMAEKELTEAREKRTAELLRQSQFRALRSQLEPHVLYNALNGLSEVIHEDPLAAEEVVARLASLYRMLTDYGQKDMASLGEERQLVEAYLSMEQMRLGERLQVEWEWPDWADGIAAPPLFLQPLVENAIKHGISALGEGGSVRIACQREGEAIALQVANTGLPPTAKDRKGVGLENLEARLDLWQEASGSFSLKREGEWTIARVEWTSRSNA